MTSKNEVTLNESVDGIGRRTAMQGTSNEAYEANEKPDERNTYFMAEINVPNSENVSHLMNLQTNLIFPIFYTEILNNVGDKFLLVA